MLLWEQISDPESLESKRSKKRQPPINARSHHAYESHFSLALLFVLDEVKIQIKPSQAN